MVGPKVQIVTDLGWGGEEEGRLRNYLHVNMLLSNTETACFQKHNAQNRWSVSIPGHDENKNNPWNGNSVDVLTTVQMRWVWELFWKSRLFWEL